MKPNHQEPGEDLKDPLRRQESMLKGTKINYVLLWPVLGSERCKGAHPYYLVLCFTPVMLQQLFFGGGGSLVIFQF